MTRTTSGNSGGGTFRIDNALGDIALTRRGIIVATSEGRVYDWLCDYIRPYEDNRYSVRYAETERDFDVLSGKQRMAMAFIEDCFFEGRALGRLNRVHKHYPKLRLIVFSVSAVSPGMIVRYVSWSHGSYLFLRAGEKEIREALETVFSGQRTIPSSLWDRIDEYSRLPDFEPYLKEPVYFLAYGFTVR